MIFVLLVSQGAIITIPNLAWHVGWGFLLCLLYGVSLILDEVLPWFANNNKRRCSSNSNSCNSSGRNCESSSCCNSRTQHWEECLSARCQSPGFIHWSGSLVVISMDSCSWLIGPGVLNILNHVGTIKWSLLESETWNGDREHSWGLWAIHAHGARPRQL